MKSLCANVRTSDNNRPGSLLVFLRRHRQSVELLERRLGWAERNVSYVPGTLTAQGYDATGKVIATDIVQTTGKLTRLRLSIESGSGGSSDVLDADDVASCVRK
jgi:hypothetical protein